MHLRSFASALTFCALAPYQAWSSSLPHYRESWLEINQYSPIDSFASQGSYGWNIGLGLARLARPSETLETEDSARLAPTDMTRVMLTKGTRWPFDFGLLLARSPDEERVWQYGGHLQWTLWEAFRMPSLAVRMSRIETEGLTSLARLRTDALQIGSSFALFSYLTWSVAMGRQWESWEWQADEGSLALAASDTTERSGRRYFYSASLKIQLPQPLIQLSLEQVRWENRQSLMNLAKIGIIL